MSGIGLVAIGRNEGERLERCLRSVVGIVPTLVYVDSGSTDGSVELARSLGVDVVELDMDQPFTAARARNAGFKRLEELDPDLDFVQFVDGDCEVFESWIPAARTFLEENTDCVIACGRRRERYPERSPYNMLCHLEWDIPLGERRTCGGDFLVKVEAFREVGMFNPELICGEEPDLCFRLQEAGGKVIRIDEDMTLHDAAMTRVSQWWRREVRSGHAYAEATHRRGSRAWQKQYLRSILIWTVMVPAVCLGATAWAILNPAHWVVGVVPWLAYPYLAVRVYRYRRRAHGDPPGACRTYALLGIPGKFAQLQGVMGYFWRALLGKKRSLIEYK